MVGSIMSLVLPVSIFILLFPKLIMLIIAGRAYLEAAYILQIVMLVAFIKPFFYQFGTTLDAIGKPHLNFWYNLLLLCDNLILTYLGLHWFGPEGAAYAAVVHYIIALTVVSVVMKQQVNADLRNVFRYMIRSYIEVYANLKKMIRKDYEP
jgi:O-antigen/teichoic acid export membrane protein